LDAERIARGILLRRLQGFGYFVVAAPIAVEAICASNEKPTSLQINCQSGARVNLWFRKISQKPDDQHYAVHVFCLMIYKDSESDEAAREFTIEGAGRSVRSLAALRDPSP
jgi:hypothetical protein